MLLKKLYELLMEALLAMMLFLIIDVRDRFRLDPAINRWATFIRPRSGLIFAHIVK